ncbi:MAG TPA: MFS transporter [Steroidobacteraceae bacterium]|jgi:predicted MFS family arabinose efflux permease|nr:MFS transporter [Steroidobacteraceae bacterium]
MMPFQRVGPWTRFLVLWAPQTLAITGRGLTTFALGVWVYERTHSATLFAMLEVSGLLPGIIVAPLLGWAVDRLGPRPAMILADAAALAAVVALEIAFAYGIASPLLVYAIITAGALVTSLRWPAYTALVTLVAPTDRLPRAAALMQVAYAGQQVVAPAVAGVLIGVIGVSGVIAIDLAASIAALVSLQLVKVGTQTIRGGDVWGDVRGAWRLIGDRSLFRLAGYIFATYLPGGMVIALATPLVLTIAGPKALGGVLAAMGLGMLAGSVVSSALANSGGGIKRLLRYDTMLVIAMLCAGFATSPARMAVIGAVFLFGLAGVIAEEQVVWQVRVPLDSQGRVFALRRAITWLSLPISYALAGPLADHVFTPAMSAGGALAGWLGPIMGTAPGRGIALLLVCAGIAKGVVVLIGARDRKLRSLDVPA